MKIYTFHTDAGHGWCEVNIKELKDLKIQYQISACSYRNGDSVYLEEDSDFSLFLTAKEQKGEMFRKDWNVIESYHEPSPIRNYNQYDVS